MEDGGGEVFAVGFPCREGGMYILPPLELERAREERLRDRESFCLEFAGPYQSSARPKQHTQETEPVFAFFGLCSRRLARIELGLCTPPLLRRAEGP